MATIKRIRDLLASGALVLAADQLLKHYVTETLVPNQSAKILDQGWLLLTRLPNPGLAFQTFESYPRGQIEFLIRYLPTVALLGFFPLYRYLKSAPLKRWENLGVGALLGAGFSNIWDHWGSYFVDDTLKIRLGANGPMIPFNLADLGLTVGLMLILGTLISELRRTPKMDTTTELVKT